MRGQDLFPGDFIYALSAPSNYIGSDQIFGENEDVLYPDMLIPILNTEMDQLFPI